MSASIDVPPLPFPVSASHPGVWRHDAEAGAVLAIAPAHTDYYVDPSGAEPGDTRDAPALLGLPPGGDFQFSARVTVDFRAQYDAGVLLLWAGDTHWAKFCFEFSPAAEPMVVSVVTRGRSDDANAFVVPDRTVWLRIARVGRAYAFHASTDGTAWQFVRLFHLDDDLATHRIGFEAQSPTGDGCSVAFDRIAFSTQRLTDLRDGS